MTLIRVDDMYIVSPLSWIGIRTFFTWTLQYMTPDHNSFPHLPSWHRWHANNCHALAHRWHANNCHALAHPCNYELVFLVFWSHALLFSEPVLILIPHFLRSDRQNLFFSSYMLIPMDVEDNSLHTGDVPSSSFANLRGDSLCLATIQLHNSCSK